MNSNTSDSRRPNRGPRSRSGGARPPRGALNHQLSYARTTASTVPALEPFACDTTPVPFTSLNLDKRLLEGIRDLGFKDTRPVQTAVIPLALAGGDIIACAETGT
ncbi:MAG: ATP-dependent helicase RhlE, partial [Acidobacteriota bacterium]|nr:ATP-dependent helicase RhlE [Acidobacteriota bacterium]